MLRRSFIKTAAGLALAAAISPAFAAAQQGTDYVVLDKPLFIHPFDDLAVATGQGTIAMEIFKELPLDRKSVV